MCNTVKMQLSSLVIGRVTTLLLHILSPLPHFDLARMIQTVDFKLCIHYLELADLEIIFNPPRRYERLFIALQNFAL